MEKSFIYRAHPFRVFAHLGKLFIVVYLFIAHETHHGLRMH